MNYRFEIHNLKSLYAHYLSFPENEDLDAITSRIPFFSSSLDQDEIMFVFFENNKIIALSALEPIDNLCYLKKYICVDPDYRNQGLGSILLEKWYEFANKKQVCLINSKYSILGKKYLKNKDEKIKNKYQVSCFENLEKYLNCWS